MARDRCDPGHAGGDSGQVTHFDVLVVGGSLSGICAAKYLQKDCPDIGFAGGVDDGTLEFNRPPARAQCAA